MKMFEILFKSIKVGVLEINDSNQYKYTPCEETKEMLPAFPFDYTKAYPWGEPIIYLKNRIDVWERTNEDSKEFGLFTDEILLRRVES